MIKVWRKAATVKKFSEACEIKGIRLNKDEVILEFRTGAPGGETDFEIAITGESRVGMIDKCVRSIWNGRPKNINEYSEAEIYAALKAKMKGD